MATPARTLKQLEMHFREDQLAQMRHLLETCGTPLSAIVRLAVDRGLVAGRQSLLATVPRAERGKLVRCGIYLRHDQYDVLKYLAGQADVAVRELLRRLLDAFLARGPEAVTEEFDAGAKLEALTVSARHELRAIERHELRRRVGAMGNLRRSRPPLKKPKKEPDPVAK